MANVMNVQIKVITPEKWRQNEWLARSENVTRGGLTMALRHHPMFHPDASRARIGPTRDVASRKNPRHVRLQKFVNQYAIVDCNACLFGYGDVWAHPDSNDHQITLYFRPVIELHISILNCRWRSTEMKLHAICLVGVANQSAQVPSESLFQRHRTSSDHRNF